MTQAAPGPEGGHPASCPWCGQQRIHGVHPSPSGDRHYRCVACGTTFFIHAFARRTDDRLVVPSSRSPYKARRERDQQPGGKR